MRTITASLLLLSVVAIDVADAAHLRTVTAYQPTQTDNGIEIVPVTFLVMSDDFSPGREIPYVCRPYLLPFHNQWNSSDLVNRNVASQAAIKATVVVNREARTLLFGDTLRVIIDLTETRPRGQRCDFV